MFSNFNDAFSNKNEIDEPIPKEIVKSLSEKLPKGFEYRGIGYDACGIMPTTSQFRIGMKVKVPEDLLEEFKPSNTKELMEYMYRAQRELNVVTTDEGCISLNGIKFKLEDMIKFPLSDEMMVGTELIIRPSQFQPPFKVQIEGESIIKYISIQRQPYADMHKSYFKNVDSSVFEIEYILDEKDNTMKFTFNINIEKSKNAKEIAEGLKLYQSLLEGKLKFSGFKFSMFVKEDKAIKKTIEFWDKITQIERKLKIEFSVEFPITRGDATLVEKLYRSFVEEKPYKQYSDIANIKIKEIGICNKEDITGNPIMFNFVKNSEIEIWGVKLNMYDSVGLFDLKVTDIVINNEDVEKYELLLEPTTDKEIYQSIRHFAKKEQGENYNRCSRDLQNAELIDID